MSIAPETRARLEQYLAWQDEPRWEDCPRCEGKGYHHGFGADGRDPDWCSDCGGSSQVPTAAGLLNPDDLIREVLSSLEPPQAHEPSRACNSFRAALTEPLTFSPEAICVTCQLPRKAHAPRYVKLISVPPQEEQA